MQLPENSEAEWVLFTKRTNEPKLRWIFRQLYGRRIPYRHNGESAHAPIIEVLKQDLEKAWEFLDPVDNIDDDDPRWERELAEMCSCTYLSPFQLDMYPPKCGDCGKPMFLLVSGK